VTNKWLLEKSENGSATFSVDKRYRYKLERTWAAQGERIVWIMLNPSTADASMDDPTIRRCVSFSQSFGAASLVVVNLFAFRATEPKELLKRPHDALGAHNEEVLQETLPGAARVVAAWGALSNKLWQLSLPSREAIRKLSIPLHCLGRAKSGAPRHPLYVRGNSPLVPWNS